MTTDRIVMIALACLLAMCSAPLALADGKDDEARAQFERGLTHADRGEIDAAIAAFEAAHAARPHPAVLFNLGQAYSAAGKPIEAVKALRAFLEHATPSIQRKLDAEQLVRFNEARIGRLVLEVKPADATLFLDGRELGLSRDVHEVEVAAGTHVLRAAAPQHHPGVEELVVQPWVAAEQRITLQLEALPPSAAPVVSAPETSGTPRMALPPTRRDAIDEGPRRRRVAAYVMAGVGLAAGGAAVALRQISAKRKATWEATDWNDPHRMVDEALFVQRLDDASLGTAIVSGVLVSSAITLWLLAAR